MYHALATRDDAAQTCRSRVWQWERQRQRSLFQPYLGGRTDAHTGDRDFQTEGMA